MSKGNFVRNRLFLVLLVVFMAWSSYANAAISLTSGVVDSTYSPITRLMYYYQMANLNLGALTTRAYLGMSLEAGNVYFEADPVTWGSLRYGGAIFVGAETVLGPAYLAWGYTEGGNKRFYLSIGRRY